MAPNLQVPYYEQTDNTTCGAACLRMALQTVTRQTAPSEAVLFAETKSSAWSDGSSPEKLAAALKTRGGQKTSTVVVAQTTGETDLIRRMVWSIHDVGVPPIALVAYLPNSPTGDGHFVVVAGYTANRDPTGPDDTGYVVSGVEFNNPLKAAADQTYPNHVSAAWWRRRYMKAVGSGHPEYQGDVVAVTGGRLGSS